MRALFALCVIALAWGAAPAAAGTLRGVVFAVIDGDTLLFRPDHVSPPSRAFLRVRLADIDAPERRQRFGDAATRALAARVLNQRVVVDTVATDAYGRTIAQVRVGAVRVNRDMVQRGLAWALTRYRRDAALQQAQQAARRARRGLWQDAAPTPPWVWRRARAASGT